MASYESYQSLEISPIKHAPNCACEVLKSFERKEIGSYSCNEKGRFITNESQLRYLSLPRNLHDVSFDLKTNLDTFIEANYEETIDRVISCLLHIGHKTTSGQGPDIVTRRGLLAELLTTPYSKGRKNEEGFEEGWAITAVKYDNKIFLTRTFRPYQNTSWGTPEQRKLAGYVGYKFEQYVSSKTPNSKTFGELNDVVDTRKAFYTLNKAKLGNHTLIYAGEVDACDPNAEGPERTYYEFKTSGSRYFNFEKKLKWWAQSVLVGIPTIVCGKKDNKTSVVYEVELIRVGDLPGIQWNPCVCFTFLDNLMTHVKKVLAKKEDNPRVAHIFTWERSRDTKGIVTYKKMKPDSEYSFLPKWYYEK